MPFDYELLSLIIVSIAKILILLFWLFLFLASAYFSLSDDNLKTTTRFFGWVVLITWIVITACIYSGKMKEDSKLNNTVKGSKN
jgi:hypothetical protein